jgi:hypothetical protein
MALHANFVWKLILILILHHKIQVSTTDVTYFNLYDMEENAKQWCNYISSTEEPHILLYNRIPKCGSTTMQQLFLKLSQRNSFSVWQTNRDYWVDFDDENNKSIRSKFVNVIKAKARNKNGVVVDGHWWQTSFKPSDFNDHLVEDIQLFRECVSRRHSYFYYSLYDSVAAKKALAQNDLPGHLKTVLKTDTPKKCLHDYDCLTKAQLSVFYRRPIELKYVCGSMCTSLNNGVNEYGALYNLRNPGRFTVSGTLEKFSEFIEMLECAYPNLLAGIMDLVDNHEEDKVRTYLQL